MSWIDVAEGLGGGAGALAVGGPIVWKLAKPWVHEVLRNAKDAADNSQQLTRNGGSHVADHVKAAAEDAKVARQSSERTERAVDKIVDKLNDHLIQAAGQAARYDLLMSQMQAQITAYHPAPQTPAQPAVLSVPVVIPQIPQYPQS